MSQIGKKSIDIPNDISIDLSEDSIINIVDIILLINIILEN